MSGLKTKGTDIVAALDVGQAKTACAIASRDAEGGLKILGAAQQLSKGIAGDGIISSRETEQMFRAVVSAAEKMAGVNINQVTVGLSGCRQRSRIVTVQQEMRADITENALLRMVERGCRSFTEEGRMLMHGIPVEYALDRATGITDPDGMYAEEAAARVHLIDADQCAVTNIAGCLARCHLDTADFVNAAYASALGCLTDCEKDLGALVIDCGAGCTAAALFKGGRLHCLARIPLGAFHITKDIAIGLCTSIEHAERLKNLYGSVIPSHNDDHEMVEFVHREDLAAGRSEPGYAPRSALIGMIAARAEEIFDILLKRLPEDITAQAQSGIVLTGGGANLSGLCEYVEQRTKAKTRIGAPLPLAGMPDAMKGAAFSSLSGLLRYPGYKRTMLGLHLKEYYAPRGPLRRMKEWFLDHV